MLEWFVWFLYSLIPFIITIAAHLSLQTMTILYFVEVAIAVIFWYLRTKAREHKSETV